MNEKVNIKSEFRCNICNKNYASKCSLCNHTKKFHINNLSINPQKSSNSLRFECNLCKKKFNRKDNLHRHIKICKISEDNIITSEDNIITSEDNIITSENKINELEKTIIRLKNQVSVLLQEKGKIHHKTLQKINNQLNNINNVSIINNTYVKFGDVEYKKILDKKQIKHILCCQYQSLEESIKKIHFNDDLPEYSNIFITNMKDDLAYVFNGTQFISIRKNEMLNELIDTHVKEINLSLEKNKNKLNEKYVTRLEKFIDMLNDDNTQFTDDNNKRIYPCYKAYKINSIKLLIYNNSHKKKLDTLNNMQLKEKIDDTDFL
jgi:hypothetical protein